MHTIPCVVHNDIITTALTQNWMSTCVSQQIQTATLVCYVSPTGTHRLYKPMRLVRT